MIKIDNLTKSFGTKLVLDRLSFHFPEASRIALVGANGCGKTTFLDLITGLEEADSGKILKPGRLRMGYLPQEPNRDPENTVIQEVLTGGEGFIQVLSRRHRAVLDQLTDSYSEENHKRWEAVDAEYRSEGGYSLESNARGILSGLGFREHVMEKDPRDLSGGWRMRLELAKIFVNNPNFLILDEPTNHLDLPSLVWVERWLTNFSGTLLFVSHDRSLLRRLPNMILHLDKGKMSEYVGNFDRFLEEKELRQEQASAQVENLKNRRQKLEKFVETYGAKASKASQAQSKLKMISRLRDLEDSVGFDDSDPETMALKLPTPPPSGREVLKVKEGAIGYETVLSRSINLFVERGQKIAIIGANGIGKSTLLKTVVDKIPKKSGEFVIGHNVKLAWFAQDQLETLNGEKSILENVLSSSGVATSNAARNVLGSFLFKGADVDKKVKVLSGGEKARVGLACLLFKNANFLILDEPTNHLDISSCEIIAEALKNFEGTVLFVSHDREFIDQVCSHIFVMVDDGRSQLFEGNLEDYQRLAANSGFPNVLMAADSAASTKPSPSPVAQNKGQDTQSVDLDKVRRDAQKNKKRLEQLESTMGTLSSELEVIEQNILDSSSDFVKANQYHQQQSEIANKLSSAENEWMELSEIQEGLIQVLEKAGRKFERS